MQENINSINIRYNRFKSNTYFGKLNFKSFDFKKGLKSVDLKDLWFINKASSENDEIFNYIVNMYLMSLDNDYSFMDDFIKDEIIPDYKAERLLDIIGRTHKSKYTFNDLKNIYKCNNLKDKKLHFFIKNSRENLTLMLIDLYHMGIYGDNIVNGKIKSIPMQKNYKKYKNNTIDLDRIKNLENF